MTAKELYEKETGNKRPDNILQYLSWFDGYKTWLENKVMKTHNSPPPNITLSLDKIFTPEVLKKLNDGIGEVLEKYNGK